MTASGRASWRPPHREWRLSAHLCRRRIWQLSTEAAPSPAIIRRLPKSAQPGEKTTFAPEVRPRRSALTKAYALTHTAAQGHHSPALNAEGRSARGCRAAQPAVVQSGDDEISEAIGRHTLTPGAAVHRHLDLGQFGEGFGLADDPHAGYERAFADHADGEAGEHRGLQAADALADAGQSPRAADTVQRLEGGVAIDIAGWQQHQGHGIFVVDGMVLAADPNQRLAA